MTDSPMSAAKIQALFTTSDGSYRFSRWGRAIAPVVFGVDDATLSPLKDAMEAVISLTPLGMIDLDPDLGANLMIFFCRDWDELDHVPNLEGILPDFEDVKASLNQSGASQYRTFRFDKDGAIRLCVMLLRYDDVMAETSVQALGTGQMVQAVLLWGEAGFERESPLAIVPQNGMCIVKPAYAALIRAAYDPALAPTTTEPTHAMRLAARVGLLLKDFSQ